MDFGRCGSTHLARFRQTICDGQACNVFFHHSGLKNENSYEVTVHIIRPWFFFTVRGRTNLRWLWDGLRPTTWCRPLSSCASPARTKWKIPYGAVQVGGRGSRNRNRPPPNTLICLPTHISPPRFFYSWMQCLIIHSVVLDSWMKGIWRRSQVMVMHVWTWLTAPTQP